MARRRRTRTVWTKRQRAVRVPLIKAAKDVDRVIRTGKRAVGAVTAIDRFVRARNAARRVATATEPLRVGIGASGGTGPIRVALSRRSSERGMNRREIGKALGYTAAGWAGSEVLRPIGAGIGASFGGKRGASIGAGIGSAMAFGGSTLAYARSERKRVAAAEKAGTGAGAAG